MRNFEEEFKEREMKEAFNKFMAFVIEETDYVNEKKKRKMEVRSQVKVVQMM